jgi:hypothetical protein
VTHINTAEGETQDMRHAILQALASNWVPRFDRAMGVAYSSMEPTNFRTGPGRALAIVTALAYEAGVFSNLHTFLSNPTQVPNLILALGNAAFTYYHTAGAVSGQFRSNWADTPTMRKIMNYGAWPTIAAGNLLNTVYSGAKATPEVISFIQQHTGSLPDILSNIPHIMGAYAETSFMGLLAYATTRLALSGYRAQKGEGLDQTLTRLANKLLQKPLSSIPNTDKAGHVNVPRYVPNLQFWAALGLLGLAATYVTKLLSQHAQRDQAARDLDNAQRKLNDAKKKLDAAAAAQTAAQNTLTQAQTTLSDAEQDLQTAQSELDKLPQKASPQTVQQAKAKRDAAQQAVQDAQSKLQSAQTVLSNADIAYQSTKAAFDTAQKQYDSAKSKFDREEQGFNKLWLGA